MNFEDKLKRLEGLVEGMGSGKMKLDEMITAFEEGKKLVGECQTELDSIRLRIEKLTKGGTLEEIKA